MTVKNPVPARLFVLLAREAPVGVILRRGPTDWVQLIHWSTKKDIFTPGQWFHGRVYEDRTDLSPDGSLLIYFAKKMTGQRIIEHKAIWTAISKPPYFTALELRFQPDTWGGGGYFENNHVVWFQNTGRQSREILPTAPTKLSGSKAEYREGFLSILYHRLERDGWVMTEKDNTPATKSLTWQKQFRNTRLIQKFSGSHNRFGGKEYEYSVSNKTVPEIHFGAVWADFDQQNRLVLAKDGKIFSAKIQDNALSLSELADFNANKHEPVETPDWAKKW